MGMAASQARYLALTARKTNTEWEGQQINQARTALANQSANLFNRLLSMEVPNAPKTTDYTKLQYSYSDGNNDSVFENWHQINTANPNYNYVVSHYYMADVFTGIKKMLQDPQVQLNNVLNKLEYNNLTTKLSKDENANLVVTYKINDYDYDQKYEKITSEQIAKDEALKTALTDYEQYAQMIKPDGSLKVDGVYGYKDNDDTWHFFIANEYNKIKEGDASSKEIKELKKDLELYETDNNLLTSDGEFLFDGIYKTQDAEGNWNFIKIEDYTQLTKDYVETTGSEDLKKALYKFEEENDLLKKTKELNYNDIYGYQDENNVWHFANTIGYTEITPVQVESDEDLKAALRTYEEENHLINEDGSLRYDGIYSKQDEDGKWSFTNTIGYRKLTKEEIDGGDNAANDPTSLQNVLKEYEKEKGLLNEDGSLNFDSVYGKLDENGNWVIMDTAGYSQFTQEAIDAEGAEALKTALTEYETENGLLNEDNSLNLDIVFGKQDDEGNWSFINTKGYTKISQTTIDAENTNALKEALIEYETENDLMLDKYELTYDKIYGKQDKEGNWSFVQLDSEYTKVRESDIDTASKEKLETSLRAYEIEHNLLNEDGSLSFNNMYGYMDKDGNWVITDTNGYHGLTKEEVEQEGHEALKVALTEYETEHNLLNEDGSLNYDNIYGLEDDYGNWSFVSTKGYDSITAKSIDTTQEKAIKKALTKYEVENDLMIKDPGLSFDGIYSYKNEDGSYGFIKISDYQTLSQEIIDKPGNEDLKQALIAYETEHDLYDEHGNLVFDGIYAYKDNNNNWQFINTNDSGKYTKVTEASIDYSKNEDLYEALYKYETEHKMLNEDGTINYDGIYGYQDSDGNWFFTVDMFSKEDSFIKAKDYIDYSTTYGPSFVGNSELHELNQLIVDKQTGIDQVSDLAQILRDCPDSAIKNFVNFDEYGNLQYNGKGIYTFNIYGQTYYTTKEDLMNSYNHARSINTIDDQTKLVYYSASYVPQKIQETNEALIEKDSDGRFKSVKFDNDSTVYNLNVEEVVNESAYNDAMNAYLNKKAQYEKTIADINAKTSIIQKEDRTLELRLKQLDTEQNALATEMDAVKKVIKDNIEKTFKTFSD